MRFRVTALCFWTAACLSLLSIGVSAAGDSGAVEPTTVDGSDVRGWRGITWGTPAEQVVQTFPAATVRHNEALEIANCYFANAVVLKLQDEAWQAWICEDRTDGTVVAVSLEKGFGGLFFDDTRRTALFDTFLAEFTAQYGPAHRYWEQCHNARWHATVQYKWFFPTTTVSLLLRDVPDGWVSIRFEQANDRPDFGPGVCVKKPVDLRG